MAWVNSFEGLIDFLSGVIIHAPDEFPKEDYLRDDEQLNLEMAFDEIRNGMKFVEQRIQDAAVLAQLRATLDASLAAYRLGDDVKGAHLIQDFERVLLEKNP